MATEFALLLIQDRTCYGRLYEGLENSYNQGEETNPKTLTGTYKLQVNYNQDPRNAVKIFKEEETNGEVKFAILVDYKSDYGSYLTKNGRGPTLCALGVIRRDTTTMN